MRKPKASPRLPKVTFDPSTHTFRSRTSGRFISPDQVSRSLEKFINRLERENVSAFARVQAGEMSVGEFQAFLHSQIKTGLPVGAALAHGGWQQLGPAQLRDLEERIYFHLGRADRWARQIRQEVAHAIDGRGRDRARQYAMSVRTTFWDIIQSKVPDDGTILISSHRTKRESCEDCIAEEAKGRRAPGEIVPIGQRACGAKCGCYLKQWRRGSRAA